jgi:hypothetical protein
MISPSTSTVIKYDYEIIIIIIIVVVVVVVVVVAVRTNDKSHSLGWIAKEQCIQHEAYRLQKPQIPQVFGSEPDQTVGSALAKTAEQALQLLTFQQQVTATSDNKQANKQEGQQIVEQWGLRASTKKPPNYVLRNTIPVRDLYCLLVCFTLPQARIALRPEFFSLFLMYWPTHNTQHTTHNTTQHNSSS